MPRLPARLQALSGNSVIKYGLTNLLPRSVAILITLVVTPLAIQKLGVLDYGLWALAVLLPNLVSSPDLGITYGVVNEMARVSQAHGSLRGERERLLGLARLLGWLALCWLTLGTGLVAWYAFGPGQAAGVEPARMFSALLLALGLFVLGISPSLWARVQLAQERGHEYLMWEGVGKVTSFVASLLVLALVPNIFLLILASLLPNVLAAYANAWKYVRTELGPRTESAWSLRRVFKENRQVFSAGKYYLAFQVTFLIGTAIDPYVVNGLLGTKEVAYLTLARRPFDALPLAVTLFSTALWPVFYRLNAANQIPQLRRLLGRITLGSGGILVILSSVIIWFSGVIYNYLSQGKIHISTDDLVWIALQTLAVTCTLVFNNYMSAMNLLRSQMWVQIVAASLGLIVKFVSLRYFGLHAYFPAASLTYVVTMLLPMTWLTLAHLRHRERENQLV